MRSEAMQQLDVLVGSWTTTMSNAWFLDPPDQEVPGSATVEWLHDAFVVFRWTMEGDVGMPRRRWSSSWAAATRTTPTRRSTTTSEVSAGSTP